MEQAQNSPELEAQADNALDVDELDAMLEEFLALPEVVATGGLETEEAPIATSWPVATGSPSLG